MARPMKVLSKQEIKALIQSEVKSQLSSLKGEVVISLKSKRGRPVGYSPKKKSKKS